MKLAHDTGGYLGYKKIKMLWEGYLHGQEWVKTFYAGAKC